MSVKSERVKDGDAITVIARFGGVPIVVFARVHDTQAVLAQGEFAFTGAYGSSSTTGYTYDAEEGIVWLPDWSDENKAILGAVHTLSAAELSA
jgi:hypothetical protein